MSSILQQLDLSATIRSEPCTGKAPKKPIKTKTKVKPQKIRTEVHELSMLQKRHESEKTVVDSIRNSFTNI